MFQCPACQATRYPGDEVLDVVETTRSPGLRRMMARAGSKSTFKEGREDLKVYAGIEVSAKDVERVAERIGQQTEAWASQEREAILQQSETVQSEKTLPLLYISYDGTGVPMTKTELVGHKGKQGDGSAKTREAKLGCIFTQTTTDVKGFPVRDPGSTSFVGAIETGRTVRPADLWGSPAPGPTPSPTGGRLGRWRPLDLEHSGDALPRGHVDYRSLSCS